MDIIEKMDRLYPISANLIDQHEAGLYHDLVDYQPGRVKVFSLRQAEHLRNEVLAARGDQYYISKLTILTDKYRLGVASRAYNRLANFVPIAAGEAKRSLHG